MTRSPTIDVLKIMAAQLIFWHHLSAYGDMASWLSASLPELYDFLFEYARMSVQVFLVVAGYLVAQNFNLDSRPSFWRSVGRRYLRLAPVYIIALLWVSLCVVLTRPYFSADWLPDAPTWHQSLAHLTLLHSLLDFPSLSTGVWYVAIDLQLYLMFMVLAYATHVVAPLRWRETLFSGLLLGLFTISLWWFSLDERWDNWAIYFFGSYGLGFLAGRSRRGSRHHMFFLLAFLMALLSLGLQWRWRIALACSTALLLWSLQFGRDHWPSWQALRIALADSSYALFLTHFGILIVFNAGWQALQGQSLPPQSPLGWAVLLLAWICSVALGMATHKWVETPMHRILLDKRE